MEFAAKTRDTTILETTQFKGGEYLYGVEMRITGTGNHIWVNPNDVIHFECDDSGCQARFIQQTRCWYERTKSAAMQRRTITATDALYQLFQPNRRVGIWLITKTDDFGQDT